MPRQEERQRANGEGYTDSYQLSDRVKKLAGRGELDAAVELVKGSSAGAGDNVIVWNGLIHATLLERKFKRAYELWMDMKRRGMTPTTRSYSTFFGGYAKMKEIDSAALARVKTIYAQWVLYSEKMAYKAANKRSIMERGEAPEEISCIPTNAYLTFLGNTKNIPLMLETLGKMPTAGVLAPNSLTYSIVLAALRASNEPENFAYAMELWQKMSAETLDIDTKTVSIVISICREAQRPDDQKIGLEVAKEFYGFVNPEEEDLLVSPKLAPPRVALDGTAMSNVMSLALGMQQYNLTARWFDQVRDNPKRFGYDVLEHYHCDLVLVALAVKKDPEAAEGEPALRSAFPKLTIRRSRAVDAALVVQPQADAADIHQRDPGVLALRRPPPRHPIPLSHVREANRHPCSPCRPDVQGNPPHVPARRAYHLNHAADRARDQGPR